LDTRNVQDRGGAQGVFSELLEELSSSVDDIFFSFDLDAV
jgi:hypothetical protein